MTEGQPEDSVAFTKRNWMGRFLRAEVSYGDVQRIMGRIDTWAQWLLAWAETAEHYEQLAQAAEARGARRSAAEAWRRAALCWHFGKFNWFDDVAKAEHAQRRLNACFERALWSLKPPGEKVLIPYGDARMAAILRKPAGIEKPPVVIVMGGLDSVKEELQQVADYFLDRGMATLGMDGPGQGETGLTLKIEPASEKPVGAAIDFLAGLGGIDANRVGLYGQSLGGYYVVRACAFEPRIKAAVGQRRALHHRRSLGASATDDARRLSVPHRRQQPGGRARAGRGARSHRRRRKGDVSAARAARHRRRDRAGRPWRAHRARSEERHLA